MSVFTDRDTRRPVTDASDAGPARRGGRGRVNSVLGPAGVVPPGLDERRSRTDARSLSGALPLRQCVVVADIAMDGDPSPWSVDAMRVMADAIVDHRRGGVLAWDLAGGMAPVGDEARRIARNVDRLLSPSSESWALSDFVRTDGHGYDTVPHDDAPDHHALDLDAVLDVVVHHRQTVLVHARQDTDTWMWAVRQATVLVLPVPHSEDSIADLVRTVSGLRAADLAYVVDRIVVVNCALTAGQSRFDTLDMRKRLGEIGIRTVLDVPYDRTPSPESTRDPGTDTARAWLHAAAVIARTIPRTTAAVPDADVPAPLGSTFDVTTATLRAHSTTERRRSRGGRRLVPVLAAATVVGVAAAAAVAVLGARSDDDAAATATAATAAPAASVLSAPEVISRYDDLYYRVRDATAAAQLWDLPEVSATDAAARVDELQRTIDAVDPRIVHRLVVTATAVPTVFDAVLTLTTADGVEHPYNQQFTVRDSADGFRIVDKIDCETTCPAP